jgi:hypothetical protein
MRKKDRGGERERGAAKKEWNVCEREKDRMKW